MNSAVVWSILLAGAYLLGSVPFGYLIARSRGIDIRQHGSRNIGATNVGRVLGQRWGMLCFALDVAKGAAAVLAAGAITGLLGEPAPATSDAWLWIAVAAAVIAGHMYTVILGFKGGKGVATGFGALGAMWPHFTIPAFAALAVWILTLRLTRYVSVSSCLAATALPLVTIAQGAIRHEGDLSRVWPFIAASVALGALVIWKHRANIARLRAGTEPRVRSRSERQQAR